MTSPADADPLLAPPRSLGEVISDSVALLRRHLKTSMVVMMPLCAVELILREASSTLLARARQATTALEGEGSDALGSLWQEVVLPALGAIGLIGLTLVLAVAIMTAATVHATEVLHGRTPTPRDVLRRALRLWPRALGSELLFDAILIAGASLPLPLIAVVAFFLPPVLGAVVAGAGLGVSVVLFIAIYLRWVLYLQAIVIEDAGPIAALSRSSQLMGPPGVRLLEGPKLRLSVVMLVYFVVSAVVQSMFILPTGIVGFLEGIPLEEMPPPLAYVPLYVGLPVAIAQVLGNSVIYPLKAYLPTVFYFDLQVRYGDLEPGEPGA